MTSLGLLTRKNFGWGQAIRSGRIKRLSKIHYLHAKLMSLLVPMFDLFFQSIVLSTIILRQIWIINRSVTFKHFRFKLKALYMYAAGFYTYSLFALIFWETRRSDFGISMGHHVATVILILLSYILRYVLFDFYMSYYQRFFAKYYDLGHSYFLIV